MTFTKLSSNFTKNQEVNNTICKRFAKEMNNLYGNQIIWSCSYIGTTRPGSGSNNVVTVQATPRLTQAPNIASFSQQFKEGTFAELIMYRLGGKCRDIMTLTTSCPNMTSATVVMCTKRPPPPSVPSCDVNVSVSRARGGLTNGQCVTLGSTMSKLYKSKLLFICQGVLFNSGEILTLSANNYNNNAAVNAFAGAFKSNVTAARQLDKIYDLVCDLDFITVTTCLGQVIRTACKTNADPNPLG